MGRPVHVKGQVLVLSGWKNSFFFSDGTAGISVDRNDTLPALNAGDLVELAGRTAPGAFAPIIISSQIRIVGKEKLPPAPLREFSELAGGFEDSQWVQVRGVVQAAWIEQSWGRSVLFLDVGLGAGHVIARVRDFSVPNPSVLIDAEVRLRGVCGTNFNSRRQFVGLRLFLADMDAVIIERAPPANPFELPLERLENIQLFGPRQRLQHRHRVSGTVTYQKTGEGLYVQDGEAGLYIETAQSTLVSVGDRIEAVGFAGSGSYSPHLRGAIVRVTGAQESPKPITLRADQVIGANADGFLTSRYDGLLVSMRGRLLERISGASQDELVLSDSGQVFRASLAKQGTHLLPELRLGSELELTGVAAIGTDAGGEPRSFELMLRAAQDVILIRSPSWWGARHSLYVLILAAGAVLACLVAVAHLRRRIRHQAEVIRALTKVIQKRERGPLPIEAPLRRWAAVGFGIAILLITSMAFLSWRGGREAAAADLGVAHTNAVLDAIDTASAHLVQLETSGRAYSLSGQADLLARFERGERNVFPDLEVLRRLTADNPEQQSRLLVLRQQAGRAASLAANMVARRKLGPYPAGADAVEMERLINAADEQFGAMRAEEKRLLEERTSQSISRRNSTDVARGLGMSLGVGFLVLAGLAIRREINLTAMARAQTFTLNAELKLKSEALRAEVAERKAAEEALIESDARRSFAMETAKLGEWSLDLIAGKATCSLRHYQIFGYDFPPPEWNIEVFLTHVDPGDHTRVREYLERCLSQKTRLDFEARILGRNGEARWIWSCGDWQESPSGELLSVGGIIADITDRKRAEHDLAVITTQRKAAEHEITKLNLDLYHRNETLERSNIDLQQFAYIASHDLQSPLRSISGFVDLLKMEYDARLDEQGREWISRTVRAIAQMQALIRDLLSYSTVDSRAIPFAPVSLRGVVDDAVGLLNSSIRDSGGRVTYGELPVIAGDRSQLVQLMQNLIGNALTYRRDDPPQIEIEAEARGTAWEVSIKDNGIGIEPRHYERIFEIFKRLQNQKEYPGTGIGLAVCRRVVERHGGRIWVESEFGRGTTFRFTIPERTGKTDEQPDCDYATSADTSR